MYLQSLKCKTKEDVKKVNRLQTDSRTMNKCYQKSSVESGELNAEAKTMTFVLVLVQFLFRKKADKMVDRRKIKFRV